MKEILNRYGLAGMIISAWMMAMPAILILLAVRAPELIEAVAALIK
jgi:hypothetical protein